LGDTIAHKILRDGYYWPTLFKDAHAYSQSFKTCQKSTGKKHKVAALLQPVVVEEPFEKWGLDIIGEISPHSSTQYMYILTATDYFTQCTEAIPLTRVNDEVVLNLKGLQGGL
jgi:hypothetical protein